MGDTITLQHNVAIMQQIARGMEHLIAEGLFHRDFSARNVLVFSHDETNVLKTSVKADFNLSHGALVEEEEEEEGLLTSNEGMSVGRHNTLSRSAAAGRTDPA